VHEYVGRYDQFFVSVQPAGIVRCKNVDLNAGAGKLAGELQGPLHAGAPGRREVEGDKEYLHGPDADPLALKRS
jgi:hypothetical protein